MTIINGKYFSKVLNRKKSFVSVLPENINEDTKSLVLLHGIQSDETSWILNTNLEELAETYNIAFHCPAGENSFYTDHDNGDEFGKALGLEFYEMFHKYFPLSRKRELNGIAGFSMGGYGALRLGLKYLSLYSFIGGFSPALIFYKKYRNEKHFNKVFSMGLEGSENDVEYLFKNGDNEELKKTLIRLRCGNDDPLDKYTFELYKKIKEIDTNMNIKYKQSKGFHDFSIWREDLYEFLKELKDIKEEK